MERSGTADLGGADPCFGVSGMGFESVSGRECHRCRRAPITGLERCRAEAARVLAAVSCFFVLTKGMSVIGPRPALPSEVKTYTDYQRQRLLLRNGLSCYWQTRRNRDTITFDEWIDLDLCGAMVPDTNHRHSQRHGYRGTGGASHDQYVKNGVLFEPHRFFAAPPARHLRSGQWTMPSTPRAPASETSMFAGLGCRCSRTRRTASGHEAECFGHIDR